MNKSECTTSIDASNISCMYTAARYSLLYSHRYCISGHNFSDHYISVGKGEESGTGYVLNHATATSTHHQNSLRDFSVSSMPARPYPPKGRTKRQSCQGGYVSLNLNVCLVGVVHCCRRIRINMSCISCTPIHN